MELVRFTTILSFLCLAATALGQNQLQLKKDSLSSVGQTHNDEYKPTYYLFDSAFVVSDAFLHKHIALAKTMREYNLILDSKDSTVFFVGTKRSVIVNGKTFQQGQSWLFPETCRSGVRILSRRRLLKLYGVQNDEGGYSLECSPVR